MNFLVETKYEYTIQLSNILAPLVFEGLNSMYTQAVTISTSENIFRNFQSFMKEIPKWNNETISRETSRILNNSKCYTWLADLIKATLKANIIILTYNPALRNQKKIDPDYYKNIKIEDFIHKIYIECARELWNNPYLFYHLYPPIELKRNQRDTINLIKDCIKEATRKFLPIKHILDIYLGEEVEYGDHDNKFENSISEVEEKNLTKLIKKDLLDTEKNDLLNKAKEDLKMLPASEKKLDTDLDKLVNINYSEEDLIKDYKKEELAKKDYERKTSPKRLSENTVGSQILKIINNNDIKFSDNRTSSEDITIDNININRNIISKDLAESETSIYLKKNEKFHEIFTNSVMEDDTKSTNVFLPQQTADNQSKFFSSYLNI